MSDTPFEAIRQILEYLDDAEEQEHYEGMVEDGEDTTEHVYLDMMRVREWLESIGENKPSRRLTEIIAKHEAQMAEWLAEIALETAQKSVRKSRRAGGA
jgi:hypothetical protein